jgi:hypothetical protein
LDYDPYQPSALRCSTGIAGIHFFATTVPFVFEQRVRAQACRARTDAAVPAAVTTKYRPNTTETEKFHRS